jgi:cytochrome c oxidase subunit 3
MTDAVGTVTVTATQDTPHEGPAGPAGPNPRPGPGDMGRFGMKLFLASLSMLFAAGMIGYLVVRLRSDSWPPKGAPELPMGLWISTLILLVSSGTIHRAVESARADRQRGLRFGLLATTVLGVAFLISQTLNWVTLAAMNLTAGANLYAFTFYVLTGLHAAHVIGGVVLLTIVTIKAFRGRYTAGGHVGVVYASMYWHFLDVVWLVMFAVLYLSV